MKNNIFIKKYFYTVEGKTEELFFTKLKTDIFRCKKNNKCKKHKSEVTHGTIPINKIKKYNECCIQICIMDEDEINNIKEYENKRNNQNIIAISKPFIEIVFYALYNVSESKISKNDCIKKLNEKLKEDKLSFTEDKKVEFVDEFIELLKKDKNLEIWIKNLEKLNEYGHSNFIEIIRYLQND